MAGIEHTITLDDTELEAALDRAIAGAQDLTPAMDAISGEWLHLVRERFENEVDPWGVPWAKRRDNPDDPNPGRKVLHLQGYLQNAITRESGADFAMVGVLKTGGPADYARIHNEGGTIKPRDKKALSFGGRIVSQVVMPKRQYLGFGPKEHDAADDILADFLTGLFRGSAA